MPETKKTSLQECVELKKEFDQLFKEQAVNGIKKSPRGTYSVFSSFVGENASKNRMNLVTAFFKLGMPIKGDLAGYIAGPKTPTQKTQEVSKRNRSVTL